MNQPKDHHSAADHSTPQNSHGQTSEFKSGGAPIPAKPPVQDNPLRYPQALPVALDPLPRLIGLGYSPWTLRAKWALKQHAIKYRYHEHLMLFEMPILRIQTRQWSGPMTVPLLILKGAAAAQDGQHSTAGAAGPRVLGDSLAIAKWADQVGKGPRVVPASLESKILQDLESIERVLDSGRALTMIKTLQDREVAKDSLPAFVPSFLRGISVPVVHVVVRYLDKEFGSFGRSEKEHRDRMRECLSQFWSRLSQNGGWLYSATERGDAEKVEARPGGPANPSSLVFTPVFSEMALALALQFVCPASDAFIRLSPGMRKGWRDAVLEAEFREMLAWRDSFLERHYPRRT